MNIPRIGQLVELEEVEGVSFKFGEVLRGSFYDGTATVRPVMPAAGVAAGKSDELSLPFNNIKVCLSDVNQIKDALGLPDLTSRRNGLVCLKLIDPDDCRRGSLCDQCRRPTIHGLDTVYPSVNRILPCCTDSKCFESLARKHAALLGLD